MTAQRTLDVAHLPVGEVSEQAPLWWGQLLLAFIEASMFFILLAMYFYIRLSYGHVAAARHPIAARRARRPLRSIPLIVSALGSYLASEAAKKNDRGGMLLGLGAESGARALLSWFCGGVSWGTWNFNWKTGAYGSIVWAIMWLHTLDAVADMIFTAVLMLLAGARAIRA